MIKAETAKPASALARRFERALRDGTRSFWMSRPLAWISRSPKTTINRIHLCSSRLSRGHTLAGIPDPDDQRVSLVLMTASGRLLRRPTGDEYVDEYARRKPWTAPWALGRGNHLAPTATRGADNGAPGRVGGAPPRRIQSASRTGAARADSAGAAARGRHADARRLRPSRRRRNGDRPRAAHDRRAPRRLDARADAIRPAGARRPPGRPAGVARRRRVAVRAALAGRPLRARPRPRPAADRGERRGDDCPPAVALAHFNGDAHAAEERHRSLGQRRFRRRPFGVGHRQPVDG